MKNKQLIPKHGGGDTIVNFLKDIRGFILSFN